MTENALYRCYINLLNEYINESEEVQESFFLLHLKKTCDINFGKLLLVLNTGLQNYRYQSNR